MENKENLPTHLRQEVEEAEQEAIARMEIEYDLRNNMRYKDFFINYPPEDIEEFIKSYACRKATWISGGKLYYQHNEDRELRFYNLAENCFWQIQQKKLFNLQCQWRAGKIKLPGVDTTMDFRYWEYNIKQCHFLAPVTQWEFELYMDYFQSDDMEINPADINYDFEWQDYASFKHEYASKKSEIENFILPLWYMFYDNRMGTDTLMGLPDLKGKKEKMYLKKYYAHINKTFPEERIDAMQPKNAEAYLSAYNPVIMEKFVRTYEAKDIVRYYLSYEKSHKPMGLIDELAEIAFKELIELGEPIPIKSNTDWREAVIDAWEEYRRMQTVKLLPLVYDDYMQKQNLNITYRTEGNLEIENDLSEWKTSILKGRELSGEPADFNF